MKRFLHILVCWCVLGVSYAKPIEIIVWHSLAGQLGIEFQTLVNGFNKRQNDFLLKPVYKGSYIEALTSFAAAFRAHQPPAVIQVFEVGTATLLMPKGIIKPAHELMKEQGMLLPEADFFPAVRASYSDKGRLMAMPFNTSVPVIFYNVEVLANAGYSVANFPTTWDELEVLAKKLNQEGFLCVYTSAYPAWILIEAYSAIHGLSMMDVKTNKAIYNNKPMVNHLERLRRWQRLHYFEYGGRSDDATTLFTSGRCPLLSHSSGVYSGLSALVPFKIGMAALPLDKDASSTRYNNVPGGAALWAVAGQKPAVYRGIAQFFSYLAEPLVQKGWYMHTGYLPLGLTGIYQLLGKDGAYPQLVLAQSEFNGPSAHANHPHLGAQNQIRSINDEALEEIFAGIKSPARAMDDAVARANHCQQRFMQNTSG